MFFSLVKPFILEFVVKAVHAALLGLIAKGVVDASGVETLTAAAGVIVTIAINVGMSATQNAAIVTNAAKIAALAPPKP